MKWRLSSLQFDLFLLILEQWQPPFHTQRSSKQKSAKYMTDFNFSQLWTETVLSFWRVRDVRIKSHVKMSPFYSSSGNFGAQMAHQKITVVVRQSRRPTMTEAALVWITSQAPLHMGGRAGESRDCTRACEFSCCQRCFKQRWRR